MTVLTIALFFVGLFVALCGGKILGINKLQPWRHLFGLITLLAGYELMERGFDALFAWLKAVLA